MYNSLALLKRTHSCAIRGPGCNLIEAAEQRSGGTLNSCCPIRMKMEKNKLQCRQHSVTGKPWNGG